MGKKRKAEMTQDGYTHVIVAGSLLQVGKRSWWFPWKEKIWDVLVLVSVFVLFHGIIKGYWFEDPIDLGSDSYQPFELRQVV